MSGTNTNLTAFTAGDLVISVYGDGVGDATYALNQAAPIVLQELTTTGTVVGQMTLPEITTVVNGVTQYAISGEYGSASEGLLQLAANGQSLVIMGYGVNAAAFNTGGAAIYGTADLAQTTSVPGGSYTVVPRVIADISYNGTVDTSTALDNVSNENNPRSVATVNGTTFYVSGQGESDDTTQGVFLADDGGTSATPIDTSTDTRTLQIYDGQLYVSRDSTEGVGGQISTYGTTLPTSATTATVLPGIDSAITLTTAQANGVNNADVGQTVNLSPENYFFATPDILYVADSGSPKEGGIGDGGLQKWVYNGTTWTLAYTLSAGLDLVPDTAAAGTTGLIGLTGTVVGNTVELYATNYTISETGQTYLYGITDSLSATTLPTDESFTTLVTAAPDTIIRGISFAPAETAVTPTNTSVTSGTSPSGLEVTSGSFLDILSGGTAISATILAGGSVTVETGGLDAGGFIAQGVTETVLGSATGDIVDAIQLVSAATAVVSDETILNGGTVELFAAGAIGNGLTIGTGGELLISGNATAADVVISGGLVKLETADAVLAGTLTFAGGTVEVTANTGAGYGDLAVISGFAFGDAIDLTATTTVGAAGSAATLSTTTSGGNTVATVSGGGGSETFVFAGTTIASSLVLGSDNEGGEELTALPASGTIGSGTTSSGAVVTSGFFLDVLSGGTITGASILSAGSVTIETGAFDTGTVIDAGGNETVLGSASLDQVYGTQLVSAATAVVNNETIYAGGTVDLFLAGVIANNLTVLSGGTANLNGHVIANDTVIQGGTVVLQSPKATISGSLTFVGAGTLEATDISDAGYGGLAVISGFGAGDVVDETLIASGATLSASLSGPDTLATITSGGVTETFIFAGLAPANLSLVSDGNGGEEIVYAAVPPTNSSVTSTTSDAVVTSGSKLTVLSGGTIVSATILSGGSAIVSSGGTDTGSVIAAGGNETVLGTATLDAVYGTQLVSAATAIVSNETVYAGGSVELFLAGAIGTGITVDSRGTLAISGHAIASNTVVSSGGLVELESPKSTLSGTLTFAGAGAIEETVTIDGISSGVSFGDLAVISGFAAGDVIDFTAATSVGAAGSAATLSATTSGGNTIETVSGGGSTETFIFAGSVGSDLILTSDGHGGVELTYSSTPSFSTSIPSGSSQSGLVVTSGSFVDVLSGGTAVSASILAGGSATIEVGGTDSGSVISAGGTELVLGSANLDLVYGTQLVSAATAIVTNETVYAGGSIELFLAGVAGTNLTVDSGGTLAISGHATSTDTVISGGTVALQSPKATLEGTLTFSGSGTIDVTGLTSSGYGDLAVISGFGTGDVIDLTVVAAGATLSTTSSGGNTVATITSGTTSQTFIFGGSVSGLQLGSDGDGGEELTLSGSTSSSSSSTQTSVTSGMTEPNLLVSGGYAVDVLAGGTIDNASILSGGVVIVQSGGLDSGSTISAGGNETILGSASGDLVYGTQLVSAATAVVSNEIVGNGGTVELFLAGVIANNLTVETGGSIAINGHAVAVNTVLSGGDLSLQSPKATVSGSLTFDGAATLSVTDAASAGYGDLAVISGFTAGDAIDLTIFGAGTTLSSTVAGGDTVAVVTSGTVTQSFTLAGTVGAGLELASDNAGGVEIVASNTVTWAVDAEGDFDTAADWSNGLVPGASNNVVIDFANDPIVLHDTGTDTVASLTNTAGDFALTGGSLTAGSLSNASLVSWTGGALILNDGNLLNTGTLSIQPNGQRLSVIGGGTLSNSGAILVSGGSGVVAIDASLANTGLLSITQGTISLNGGGASSGYGIEVGSAGVLQFGTTASGGSNTFAITGGFFAPDAVVVAGGTLAVSAAATAIFVDTLDITAGLLNLGGLSSTDQGSFSQTGGTLSTTGTFSVVSGGTLAGGLDTGTGTLAVDGGSFIGGGVALAGGLTLLNEQSLTWSSGGIALAGATLVNDDVVLVTADAAITGTGTLDNSASTVIAVYAGSGTTGIDAVVDNDGGIQVQTGTLSLNGGGHSAGSGIYTASGAVLAFGTTATGDSNVFSITSGFFAPTSTELNGGTLDVSGASGGVVFVDSLAVAAGALVLGAVSPTDQGTLTQTGGLITGTGTLTVIDGASLTGGEQSGTGTTTLFGGSSIGGGFEIAGGRTLLNDQTLTWSSGGIVLDSGTLQNDGVLLADADATIAGTGTLANAAGAVIAIYAGSGVTDVDADTSNDGDIQVQTGTLSLNGGGTSNASDLFVASGAVMQFGNGTFSFTGGLYTVATTEITGGTVNFAEAAAIGFTNSLSISAGTAEFGDLPAVAGTFSQTGGTLSATGFFTVNGGAQLDSGLQTGAGVTVLDGSSTLGGGMDLDGGRILDNTGTLTWSGGTLTLGGGDPSVSSHGGILVNAAGATLDIGASGSIVSAGSGSVFNAGTIQVTGGSSAVDVAFSGPGTVIASAGTLALNQAVTGDGTFLLDGSATLDFAAVVGGSPAMQFLATGGTLETQATGMFGATISGFSTGDLIDAAAVVYNVSDAIAFAAGTLTVSDGSHSVAFGLLGDYTSNQFHLLSDGHGGTAIQLG